MTEGADHLGGFLDRFADHRRPATVRDPLEQP